MYVGGFEIFFQLILYPYLDCWNGLTRLLQQHQQRRRHVHVQSSPIPSIQMLFTKVNCTVWYRISASRYDAESGLMSSSLFEQSIESKSGTSLLFKGFKFTFKRLRLKIRLLQQKKPKFFSYQLRQSAHFIWWQAFNFTSLSPSPASVDLATAKSKRASEWVNEWSESWDMNTTWHDLTMTTPV